MSSSHGVLLWGSALFDRFFPITPAGNALKRNCAYLWQNGGGGGYGTETSWSEIGKKPSIPPLGLSISSDDSLGSSISSDDSLGCSISCDDSLGLSIPSNDSLGLSISSGRLARPFHRITILNESILRSASTNPCAGSATCQALQQRSYRPRHTRERLEKGPSRRRTAS